MCMNACEHTEFCFAKTFALYESYPLLSLNSYSGVAQSQYFKMFIKSVKTTFHPVSYTHLTLPTKIGV